MKLLILVRAIGVQSMFSVTSGSGTLYLARISGAAQTVANWWTRELLAALPPNWAEWARGKHSSIVCVLRPSADGVELTLTSGGTVVEQVLFPDNSATLRRIDEVLSRHGRANRANLALALEPASFFTRRFDVPTVALTRVANIARAEIERKTPFRLAEIYCSHSVEQSTDGASQATIVQTIVKKALVEDAASASGLSIEQFDCLVGLRSEGDDLVRVSLKDEPKSGAWAPRLAAGLGLSAVLMLGVAFGLAARGQTEAAARYGEMLAQAKSQLSAATTGADRVRQELTIAARLREMKTQARFLDIWEELTRVLPNDSWLSDLQFTDSASGARTLNISGYSRAAAELVGAFDRSPIFERTALTAAITPEPGERRERFSLQTTIRTRNLAKGEVK